MLNLDVESNITVDSQGNPVDFMGVKANVHMTGDCKGTISINKENGITGNGNLIQNMNGEMEILAGKSANENFKMPIKTTTNISFETTKR